MGAVAVHLDAVNLLAVDITGYVAAALYYEAFPAFFLCLLGEDRAEEAGAYYQIVVFHLGVPPFRGICFWMVLVRQTFFIIADCEKNSNTFRFGFRPVKSGWVIAVWKYENGGLANATTAVSDSPFTYTIIRQNWLLVKRKLSTNVDREVFCSCKTPAFPAYSSNTCMEIFLQIQLMFLQFLKCIFQVGHVQSFIHPCLMHLLLSAQFSLKGWARI